MTKTPIIVAAALLFAACNQSSKEAKVRAACERIHTKDKAACGEDRDCLAGASAKFDSCLGFAKAVGNSAKPSLADEVAREQKACDGGDQEACAVLGGAYLLGKGVPADPAKGVALVAKACSANSPTGCELYGRAFERGLGVTADPQKMASTMEKACDLGRAGACRARGMAFDAMDPQRMPHLQKACDGKDGIGCMALGAAYMHGQGTKKDAAKAKLYLQRACDLEPDLDQACASARQL